MAKITLLALLSGCYLVGPIPNKDVTCEDGSTAERGECSEDLDDTADTGDTSDSGTHEDSGTETGSPDTADTVEECSYTLHISDTAPYDPICSGELEYKVEPTTGDLLMADDATVTNTWYYDGTYRYVVGHGSVFASWWGTDECACEQVKAVPVDVAASITLGGNLTIKPGAFIIGTAADPTRYVIESPCTVRPANEDVLAEIYGEGWEALVRTLPEYFFVDYALGEEVATATDYDLSAASATTLEEVLAECNH